MARSRLGSINDSAGITEGLYLVRVVIRKSVQVTSRLHMRIYDAGLELNPRNGSLTVGGAEN